MDFGIGWFDPFTILAVAAMVASVSLWPRAMSFRRCVLLRDARDGFVQHYTPLQVSLVGLVLNPAA